VKEGKEIGLKTPVSSRFGKRIAVTEPIKFQVYQRSRVRFLKPRQMEAGLVFDWEAFWAVDANGNVGWYHSCFSGAARL
jgi:hypothetical protein